MFRLKVPGLACSISEVKRGLLEKAGISGNHNVIVGGGPLGITWRFRWEPLIRLRYSEWSNGHVYPILQRERALS